MVRLISQYRVLPQLAGRDFLPVAFLARLPISMVQIGTVILVTAAYSSVAAGGLAAGFLAAGTAVGGPVIGRLADRFGQRAVMLPACLLDAAAVLALVAAVAAHSPLPAVAALALLAGAATPQIGALVRTRWVWLTGGGHRLHYAMSYEGAADEAAYVLGPAVVSGLTLLASPTWAMITAAMLVGVFGSAVALHSSAEPADQRGAAGPPALAGIPAPANPAAPADPATLARPATSATPAPPATEAAGAAPGWTSRMIGLLLGGVAIGLFFGSTQTAVTGIARAAGAPGSAGAMYAAMGVGSALAALGCAALPVGFGLPARLLTFGSAIAVLAVPLLMVSAPAAVVVLMVPLGLAVGPYLITLMSLMQQQVPARRMSGVLTALSSATVVGSAIGAAVGGRLVQHGSPSAGFLLAIAAMTAGALVAGMQLGRPIPPLGVGGDHTVTR